MRCVPCLLVSGFTFPVCVPIRLVLSLLLMSSTSEMWDVIIVGAGLAGAAAAVALSQRHRVLVLEADRPAAGASGAAAGLVNPLMGRKANTAWQAEAALDALRVTLDAAGAAGLMQQGVLRPASTVGQADRFEQAAARVPHLARWLSPSVAAEMYPWLPAPHGLLDVHAGGALSVPAWVGAQLRTARRRGAQVLLGVQAMAWTSRSGAVEVEAHVDGEPVRYRAQRLVLAAGWGLRRFGLFERLRLHGVKGQTVEIDAVRRVPKPVSGYGYVVPADAGLVVGSSYEHQFDDVAPSPSATARILAKANRMLPGLQDASVRAVTAGIRITAPGHLPRLGPLPDQERVWVFTALGSKGVLLAPYLAGMLPSAFADSSARPSDIRTV